MNSKNCNTLKIITEIFRIIILILLAMVAVPKAFAQVTPTPATTAPVDSVPGNTIILDTITRIGIAGDTISDSVSVKTPQGDIKTTIKYSAEDSISFDVVNQLVYLYGKAKIDYGDLSLEAEYITISWKENTLTAKGKIDSTGRKVGIPNFKQGADSYVADNIKYNYKTRKGLISGAVTQQGEGYLHAETLKKNQFNEMYARHSWYTTCNLEHPHFYIQSNKIKMIPGDKLVSGPFNLYIADVPTPLGFLFGMFPTPRRNASGIIIPAYGEEQQRGFFLRDGGFHWAVNDYIGLTLRGSIYSKGSYGLSLNSNYRKRYAYDGGFLVNFNNTKINSEVGETPYSEDFWVQWSHTPQTRKSSRFSTSVSAGTSRFNSLNTFDPQRYLSPNFNSNISYSKTFTGTPFNLSANLRQDQNVQTGVMNFTLPDVNFSMNRIYPFRPKGAAGNTWYEKIGFSYNFNAQNRISNNAVARNNFNFQTIQSEGGRNDSILKFNRENLPEILSRAQIGAKHSIPVSTSFTILKYFTVSPSANYEETWYLRRNSFTFNPDSNKVEVNTVNGFSRAYTYGTGVAMTTRFYGFFPFGGKRIEAIRHQVIPSVGFNYAPDFSDPRFGIYQDVRTSVDGTTSRLSPYSNSVFGPPGGGRQGNLSFSLSNQFEMKVKTKGDTANKTQKITLLDNLGISSSYNLMADSFNLAPFNIVARTRILNNFDITVTANVDPYGYDIVNITNEGERQSRRVNQYAWQRGQGIGHLTQGQLSLTTNLNPAAFKRKTSQSTNELQNTPIDDITRNQIDYINANPADYVDFNIPWSLLVSYNLTYNKSPFTKSELVQVLNLSGDISVTENWKIGASAPYDFQNGGFGYTSLNIYRNLHCWDMSFSWIPFGQRQSYTFDIKVKASILQDLKLSRRRSWFDSVAAGNGFR